jgi:hypothetical protein
MSSPRLTLMVLPIALGLPLLAGACDVPLAVTAAGYGADGVSLAETNKTAADHLTSMVSKKDCALWRMFRNQHVCRARDGDHDPYDVNYNEPFRQGGEGGIEYLPPPHAAGDAPTASWDVKAYAGSNANAPQPSAPATAAAGQMSTPAAQAGDATSSPPVAVSQATPAKKPAVKHAAAKPKRLKKKHAPSQAATAL